MSLDSSGKGFAGAIRREPGGAAHRDDDERASSEAAGGYLRNGFAEDYDLWLRLAGGRGTVSEGAGEALSMA